MIKTNKFVKIFFLAAVFFLLNMNTAVKAQRFDFDKLQENAKEYTVILEISIEISFGMNSSVQNERFLGTIVSDEGLVIFNGSALINESGLGMHGFAIKTEPGDIKVITLDGTEYNGEYIGNDQYTKFGFVKIITETDEKFEAVKFENIDEFVIGDWLALYMLLPSFIEPPLAADVGMISNLVKSPQEMPLTIGFNSLQLTSVLYNEKLQAVGILGSIPNPSSGSESGGFGNSRQFGIPLQGVITADKLQKIISSPPKKGNGDRGWLGISLQAFTEDMSEFWNIDTPGGIIVNEVVPRSPAFKGGLIVGDIIFSLNGQRIEVDREEKLPIFQRTVSELGPGAALELAVYRPGENSVDTVSLFITLDKAPIAAMDAPEYKNEILEFSVRSLVFSDYMLYNLDEDALKGARVSDLKQGGLANIGGLRIGDIIQRVDNEEVISIENVEEIMDKISLDKPREVIFFIWRNYKTLFVNIKTDWQ